MRSQELPTEQINLGPLGSRWALYSAAAGLIGVVGTIVLASSSEGGVERFFRSYLVAFMFFLSLGLGALFFVLVTHVTRAGWGVALRRITEVVSLTLLPLFLFSLVIFAGQQYLYEWSHADALAHDELLQHKASYLNSTFFLVRIIGYFLIWNALAFFFTGQSVKQDATGEPRVTRTLEKLSAPGLILFAVTVSFASFDFLMSLYPHWYSTIYGVYYFAGSTLGMFCLVTLLVVLLQSAGKLTEMVTTEHYHDLGKLMFAFVVFWAYIAFSQYMLIWVAAIPEETVWYQVRSTGLWAKLSMFLLVGHFFLPFLWLISRIPKRRKYVLVLASVWLLFMHWFDLFWLVMPEVSPNAMPFHLLDLTCMLGLGGIFMAVVFWRLGQSRLVPLGDPRLDESLSFENV